MTRDNAWKIWLAILDKLKENGHEIIFDKQGECGGTYVNVILKASDPK